MCCRLVDFRLPRNQRLAYLPTAYAIACSGIGAAIAVPDAKLNRRLAKQHIASAFIVDSAVELRGSIRVHKKTRGQFPDFFHGVEVEGSSIRN